MRRVITIGIDEVGRGALAGPVVLAAVLSRRRPPAGRAGISWFHPTLGRIRDSKKLTPKRRKAWFSYLIERPGFEWRVARVSPRVIDRINIARAANLAAYRLVQRLSANYESRTNIRIRKFVKDSLFADGHARVLLDGGLRLPPHIAHRVIIRGDERVPLIAAASIVAKVWRDRLMVRLAAAFPRYGFEIHKGYGTKLHRRMLRRHGPSAVHRRTFLRRVV